MTPLPPRTGTITSGVGCPPGEHGDVRYLHTLFSASPDKGLHDPAPCSTNKRARTISANTALANYASSSSHLKRHGSARTKPARLEQDAKSRTASGNKKQSFNDFTNQDTSAKLANQACSRLDRTSSEPSVLLSNYGLAVPPKAPRGECCVNRRYRSEEPSVRSCRPQVEGRRGHWHVRLRHGGQSGSWPYAWCGCVK